MKTTRRKLFGFLSFLAAPLTFFRTAKAQAKEAKYLEFPNEFGELDYEVITNCVVNGMTRHIIRAHSISCSAYHVVAAPFHGKIGDQPWDDVPEIPGLRCSWLGRDHIL